MDCAYVLADEAMQDREQTYVQLSRARHKTRIFMTEAEVGEDVATLARRIARSRQEQLALHQQRDAEQRPALELGARQQQLGM